MDDRTEFLKRVLTIHRECHTLCKHALGHYLAVSGNIGVFSQSDSEYHSFEKIRAELTLHSANINQKYFKLIEPIRMPSREEQPETIYTHLYVRKFDPTPYGRYLGDIDFVLAKPEYLAFKERVLRGEIAEAQLYNRPGWDTVQITREDVNCVAYISTAEFAEKVRVKFD